MECADGAGGVVVQRQVGDLDGLESGLVGAEDRPSPGALPVGDLAGASPELDEDPRLPSRDRRRQSAASAGSPAAAEGRGGSGAAGEGGADLTASWTPNEIAGRLRLEATDPTVERMANSPDARGRTVSGEAIYQYIYAIPKGELARKGIFLQSKRTKRDYVRPGGRAVAQS